MGFKLSKFIAPVVKPVAKILGGALGLGGGGGGGAAGPQYQGGNFRQLPQDWRNQRMGIDWGTFNRPASQRQGYMPLSQLMQQQYQPQIQPQQNVPGTVPLTQAPQLKMGQQMPQSLYVGRGGGFSPMMAPQPPQRGVFPMANMFR